MSRNNFKISLIAASVMAATSSQAALYKVVEIGPASGYEAGLSNGVDITEFYGSAIDKSKQTGTNKGCFGEDCSSNAIVTYGDSRAGSEGHSYRQEVPFNYDSSFYYTDWGRNRDYCRNELGYQTCDPAWTDKLWYSFSDHGGLRRERDAWNSATYKSNAQVFKNGSLFALEQPLSAAYSPSGFTYTPTSSNAVVNGVDSNGVAIGNTSSGYYNNGSNSALIYRHRGFWGDGANPSILLPKQDGNITQKMGRTMAFDSFKLGSNEYIVGSAAVAPFDYNDSNKNYRGSVANCINNSTIKADPAAYADCQNFAFATKATIWDVTGVSSATEVQPDTFYGWQNTGDNNIDKKASQGSIRGVAVSSATAYSGKPVFVGLNTTKDGSNLFMQATVFTPNTDFAADKLGSVTSRVISRATVKDGDDFVYSNSVATDINKNLVVIGEAKRRGDKRENGAAPNRMFLASIDSSGNVGSAQYFDELNGNSGIFFRGAGGETGAINNFNEIVGAVDAEQSTEYFGKKRRQRGFIYPYTVADSGDQDMIDRRAIFQNRPWLLDDLTNGGQYSASNNKYRIVDASDINDDGVIVATALKCQPNPADPNLGYDTTGHNSYCGNGQTREKVVAVKLIPIANATSADIQTRALEAAPVERQGGGLGWMAMIFLGFLGLRRNK
ncbi:DUF3466 family protein [Vibrio mediterranei]|uniref:DUF3466 family protein n=1 Tax=Vibrio mediterranei TaxID=689 RepID=A0AAN1FHZ9_9VIBR|nr:DUF3466 family protein [Vibrio mediterranei]ASI90979.1 hypothetical protein BSZ05_14905 [Vibrio mediterranei]